MIRSAFLAVVLFFTVYASPQTPQVLVSVVDPRGTPLGGARVELVQPGGSVIAIATTNAEGVATFNASAGTNDTVHVLAAGFAPETLTAGSEVTAHLRLASVARTVIVTADRTPMAEDASGSKVSTLDSAALTNLQPVSTADALRVMPGAVINTAGQRGGLASLFVRGGESRYNKVIVDDVVVNDPGGNFNFGFVPTYQVDRVELVRGADSALYGSDAMTSVVQFSTRSGSTRTPELRFGADGGTFQTAHGYTSLAGARGWLDYNLFAEQFNTQGQGPNDEYSNSSQGGNVGFALPRRVFLRVHARHANARAGVPGEWQFIGRPSLPPDLDQRARQNDFLASTELRFATPARWQHRLVVHEYNHRRLNEDLVQEPGRATAAFGNFDFPFADTAHINRAGVNYQADYSPRDWARSIFGYQFEDENGFFGDAVAQVNTHGLRRNHELYGEQMLVWRRLSLIGGGRFVRNESFGNRGVPRVAATAQVLRGRDLLSGTRLRFGYSEGIKEPRFEESFGQFGFGIVPNPNLRPERNRALEAGFEQSLFGGGYSVSGTYFNNLFTDLIDFSFDATTFLGQYININRALAHGAELEFHGRPSQRLRVDAAYVYTSTQILRAPLAFDALHSVGAPLIRRPRHNGNVLLSYFANRWGGDVGASFVGRRSDSDFLGLVPPITSAPGYALVNSGLWLAATHRVTAYVNIENLLNREYQEVLGYPGLRANFRAGLRFRVGGD